VTLIYTADLDIWKHTCRPKMDVPC